MDPARVPSLLTEKEVGFVVSISLGGHVRIVVDGSRTDHKTQTTQVT